MQQKLTELKGKYTNSQSQLEILILFFQQLRETDKNIGKARKSVHY